MNQASLIELDPHAIAHNMRVLRAIVGADTELCAIVKADAYGLGLDRIAPRLIQSGIDMLAVFSIEEAADLARLGTTVPTLVMGPVRETPSIEQLYRPMMSGRLQLTVHDLDHARELEAMSCRLGIRLGVTVEIDSGMYRGGCSIEDAGAVLELVDASSRLELTGLMTHFAAAAQDDDFTRDQLERFDSFLERNRHHIGPSCRIHAANTYATLRHARYHKTLARVGIGWSGYGLQLMSGGERIEAGWELKPCFRWTSRVVQIKRVPAGERIGYGRRWTASRDSIVGLIPVGYAAGYPRSLSGTDDRAERAEVGVYLDDGERFFAPVVGAINMDQLAIDLTDAVSILGSGAARVGAPVDLIGADSDAPNAVTRLAMIAGTIPHELMCGIHPRIRREFRREVPQPEVVVGAVLSHA